ncbi:MAG TPA: hypothetical protein HA252_01665 [Candidatus Diapherotrites archaeon]|uniref:Antitoxin n=1 Tax=Candidatus Iainarchaeum sp. TaxID=3101447 RepID=A0A7J4JEA4_9ARCH|nr:hypothetical protein [Candidatus Diapherotrites archaeon]HIH16091.1 hypothetical protein [Candidatus Diapherotrites archaeon]
MNRVTTTIQVRNETKARLDNLKKSYKVKTYDEAITTLVRVKRGSMYGVLARKGKKYSLKELLKDLRDKSDRF